MDDTRIIADLGLEPSRCGYMGRSYGGDHGAALYFLITTDRPGHAHRLDVDQIYHYYDGAPLEVVFMSQTGLSVHKLGRFGDEGAVAQLIIPADTLHASRTTGSFTLACTTSFSDRPPAATDPSPDELALLRTNGFV